MNYLKYVIGIILVVSDSRFIPHPPNFTSLIALSFYLPAFFGYRFIPAIIISFAVTDLVIGFHGLLLFTWGSAILIGLLSHYFHKSLKSRMFGALSGAIIFFINAPCSHPDGPSCPNIVFVSNASRYVISELS